MKPIDKIFEILPVPIILGIAIVFGAGWVLKEIKGFASFGPVIQNPYFQSIIIATLFSVTCFYGIKAVFKYSIPTEFAENQRGIYVSVFDGTSKANIQLHTIEALKTAISGSKEFADVKITKLNRQVDYELAKSIAKVSNASFVIYGVCITDSIIHYKVLNGENHVEARYEISDFPKIEKVTKGMQRLLLTTKPKTGELSPTIAYLQNKIENVEKRNKELDNKVDALKTALYQLDVEKPAVIEKFNKEIRSTYANQKKYIFAVGVNDYHELPDLRFAVADATGIVSLFKSNSEDNTELFLLTDKEATRVNILSTLNKIAAKSMPNDQVVVYFGGQGITTNDGAGYILPSDVRPNMLESSSISMRDVGSIFKKIKAEQLIMFVDACYSGAFDVLGHRGIRLSTDTVLETLPSGKGRVVITAGTSTQAVSERSELGHGVFTYYLLKGLSGDASLHGDGVVTVSSLFNYLQQSIQKETEQYGIQQTPTMFSQEFTDFVVAVYN